MGMDDRFTLVCGQILLSDPLPCVNKVFSLIIQEEEQLGTPSAHSQPAVMALKLDNNRVPVGGGKTLNKPQCTHCGKSGHTIDKCYRLHGFPPGFKFTKSETTFAHLGHTDHDEIK